MDKRAALSRSYSQQGFSLIELSIAIVVLGILTGIFATLHIHNQREQEQVGFTQITDDAQQAVLGFIFANSRLPCPASSSAGIEDCSLQVGFFPYKTVGMLQGALNSAGLPLRYALYSKAGVLEGNIELGKVIDRFRPFMADVWSNGIPPLAQLQTVGNANSLDICQAVQSGYLSAPSTSYLVTGSGTSAQPVAYLLFSAGTQDANGDGNLLDGVNTANGVVFESLRRSGSLLNDDQLKAVHFNQLWEQLGCNGVLSPTGHAHPNAVTTAVLMQQSLVDYKVQLDIATDIASADIAAAAASIAGAAAGVAAAAATPAIATAEAINTAGAMVPAIAASAAAVTLAAAGAVSAGLTTAIAIYNKVVADELLEDVEPLITQINALAATTRTNALAADAAGLYDR